MPIRSHCSATRNCIVAWGFQPDGEDRAQQCEGFESRCRKSQKKNSKMSLTCFFNLKTLNLSKSVSARLFSRRSRRFAQALSSHFSSTFCSFQAFATGARPAARGNFAMTIGVTMRFARLLEWRGTPAFSFVEGPSTRTCRWILASSMPL